MCCWAVGMGLNLGLWLKVIILPLYHWSFYQNSWKLDNWFMSIKREFVTTHSIKREFVTTKCEQEVIVVYFSSKQLWAVIHTCYIYLIQDRISFFSCLFFLWILSRQLYFWLVLFKVTRYEKRRKKGKAWSSFNQQNAFKRPYKIT